MVTYRWSGHVGPTEDSDVGVKRTASHVVWKNRDPVRRLIEALISEGVMTQGEIDEMHNSIKEVIASNWEKALASPYPEKDALLNLVYTKH